MSVESSAVEGQLPGNIIEFEIETDNYTKVLMVQEAPGQFVPFYSPRGFHRAEVTATPTSDAYNVFMEGRV